MSSTSIILLRHESIDALFFSLTRRDENALYCNFIRFIELQKYSINLAFISVAFNELPCKNNDSSNSYNNIVDLEFFIETNFMTKSQKRSMLNEKYIVLLRNYLVSTIRILHYI